jgi:hypothetical protein
MSKSMTSATPAKVMTGKMRSPRRPRQGGPRRRKPALARQAQARDEEKEPVLSQERAARVVKICRRIAPPEHRGDGHGAEPKGPTEQEHGSQLQQHVERRKQLEEVVARRSEAREELTRHRPDRRRVVAVVESHPVPVVSARDALEPGDVRLERSPARRRKVPCTASGVAEHERLGHRHDQVLCAEVADILPLQPLSAPGLDLGDGRARVESIIADLGEVLRTEVVVIELVAVVIVGVARVRIEEVEVDQER